MSDTLTWFLLFVGAVLGFGVPAFIAAKFFYWIVNRARKSKSKSVRNYIIGFFVYEVLLLIVFIYKTGITLSGIELSIKDMLATGNPEIIILLVIIAVLFIPTLLLMHFIIYLLYTIASFIIQSFLKKHIRGIK